MIVETAPLRVRICWAGLHVGRLLHDRIRGVFRALCRTKPPARWRPNALWSPPPSDADL